MSDATGLHQADETRLAAANRLIDEGSSIAGIRHYFKDKSQAIGYYGVYQQAKYSRHNANGTCFACSANERVRMVRIRWAALFSRFHVGVIDILVAVLGHLHIPLDVDAVVFETFHHVCDDCWRSIARRRTWAKVLYYVGMFAVMVGIPTCLLLVLTQLGYVPEEYFKDFIIPRFVGVAALITGILALWGHRRFLTLSHLHDIPRRPFSKIPESIFEVRT